MKKKRKETNEERLLHENRELKALNRSLMKRIKKLDRNFKETEENTEEDVPDAVHYEVVTNCPDCFKGTLTIVLLAGRRFSRCSLCEYRTKAVKV